jgi:transcriptional regulator with XRE-family HTH domain
VSEASQFVAARLREIRERTFLSQEQASQLTGITFNYYQKLESGKVVGIRLTTIEKAAKAFGLDVPEFFSKRKPKMKSIRVAPPPHRHAKGRNGN